MTKRDGDGMWQTWKLSDLKKHRLDPKHYIAGEGWIKRGGGTLLIGATGMGKSVLGEQIACSIASGKKILNTITVNGPKRVLYLEAENDADVLKRDILSVVEHIGADENLIEKNFLIQHVYGVTGSDFHDLALDAIEKHKPDVLIVDPYQSFISGDINKSETFLNWMGPIDHILKRLNMAMVLVAHKPKPRDVSEWDIRELVYQAAGTSTLSNWARSSCELSPLKGDPTNMKFKLTFSKGGDRTGYDKRELYIEHSGDRNTPYWSVSENQNGEYRVQYGDAIAKMAHEHPDWSMRKIADSLGCAVGVVSKYYPRDARKK